MTTSFYTSVNIDCTFVFAVPSLASENIAPDSGVADADLAITVTLVVAMCFNARDVSVDHTNLLPTQFVFQLELGICRMHFV